MKASSTRDKSKKIISALVSAVFWTALWELLSLRVGKEVLLPSPIVTLRHLAALASTEAFWHAAGMSLFRVALGFAA